METDKNDQPATPVDNKSRSYWNKWYTVVIVFLLLQVVLYYYISVQFK